MTPKEYLMQVRYIDRLVDSKLEQLARLKETATKATMTLSDMPHSDSPDLQSMEITIVKIVDLEREIDAEIDRLVDFKREVRSVIEQIPNADQRLILELRYLCYKPWNEIATELSYSVRHVTRLHGWALRNLPMPKSCP